MSLISPVLLFNRRPAKFSAFCKWEREREGEGETWWNFENSNIFIVYIYTFKFNLRSWHPNVCAVALHKGLYLCCMYCNARCAIFVYATHVASHI